MQAFAQKPLHPRERITSGPARPGTAPSHASLHSPHFGYDFGRTPIYPAPAIQAKLAVNRPGDEYEQEADRVAGMVMQAPDHATAPAAPDQSGSAPSLLVRGQKRAGEKAIEDEEDVPIRTEGALPAEKVAVVKRYDGGADGRRIQAKVEGIGSLELEPETATRIKAMQGAGRPLASSERRFVEPRFGADFSAVRVHTGQEADTYSRALNARAFTVGSDIFFRAGEYRPGVAEGRRLLAHELVHTIQQGAVHVPNASRIGARSTAVPLVQRQPPAPAPAPAPVAAPAGRATVNYLPVIHDQTPTGWGVTKFDDIVVDITAYASGTDWKCVVTKADQQTRQGVRLLPGVVEVTAALVAAETSCATLKTMITSLDTVANQGSHSGYYMLAAVQAHEDLHITQYRGGLDPAFTTFKTAVEALTVPLAAHANAAAAKAAIKALPAYTTAAAALHAADVAANNATAAHSPVAPFNTAEHGVVDPMITTIRSRRTTLTCPP